MLNNFSHPSSSNLFEELSDQFSEKVCGGASLIQGPLLPLVGLSPFPSSPFGNNILSLLNPDLQTSIDQKIQELYPNGLGNTAALACATNENGDLVCEVSAEGLETQSFTVEPLQ